MPDLVAEMCGYVNENWHMSAIHLAAYLLWRMNWIHPFADGNGRTARVVSYVVLSVKLDSLLPGAPGQSQIRSPLTKLHTIQPLRVQMIHGSEAMSLLLTWKRCLRTCLPSSFLRRPKKPRYKATPRLLPFGFALPPHKLFYLFWREFLGLGDLLHNCFEGSVGLIGFQFARRFSKLLDLRLLTLVMKS